jgi:hypothetical protein
LEQNAVTGFWLKLLNHSILTRWLILVLPITALLWIPGIVGVTAAPNARVWDVKLLYWSIYLTVLFVRAFGRSVMVLTALTGRLVRWTGRCATGSCTAATDHRCHRARIETLHPVPPELQAVHRHLRLGRRELDRIRAAHQQKRVAEQGHWLWTHHFTAHKSMVR